MDKKSVAQLESDLKALGNELGTLKEKRSNVRNFTQLLMGFKQDALELLLNIPDSIRGPGGVEDPQRVTEKVTHANKLSEVLDGTGRRLARETGIERIVIPRWDDFELNFRKYDTIIKKVGQAIKKGKRAGSRLKAMVSTLYEILSVNEIISIQACDLPLVLAYFCISTSKFFAERVVTELPPGVRNEMAQKILNLSESYKVAIERFEKIRKDARSLDSKQLQESLSAHQDTLNNLAFELVDLFKTLRPYITQIIDAKSTEFDDLGAQIKKLEKVDIPQKEQELHEASRQEAPMKPALKAAQAPRLDVSALQRELNSYVKRYRETLQVLQKMFPRLGLRIDSVHNIIGLTPTARNRIEQSQHGKDILSDLEKETARAKKLMGRINSILATGGGK